MSVRSEGRTIFLEGDCGVEQAETLLAKQKRKREPGAHDQNRNAVFLSRHRVPPFRLHVAFAGSHSHRPRRRT